MVRLVGGERLATPRSTASDAPAAATTEAVVRARGLCGRGASRTSTSRSHRGEILGIGGLLRGRAAASCCGCSAGVQQPTGGTSSPGAGAPRSLRRQAGRGGIGYLAEGRVAA